MRWYKYQKGRLGNVLFFAVASTTIATTASSNIASASMPPRTKTSKQPPRAKLQETPPSSTKTTTGVPLTKPCPAAVCDKIFTTTTKDEEKAINRAIVLHLKRVSDKDPALYLGKNDFRGQKGYHQAHVDAYAVRQAARGENSIVYTP